MRKGKGFSCCCNHHNCSFHPQSTFWIPPHTVSNQVHLCFTCIEPSLKLSHMPLCDWKEIVYSYFILHYYRITVLKNMMFDRYNLLHCWLQSDKLFTGWHQTVQLTWILSIAPFTILLDEHNGYHHVSALHRTLFSYATTRFRLHSSRKTPSHHLYFLNSSFCKILARFPSKPLH